MEPKEAPPSGGTRRGAPATTQRDAMLAAPAAPMERRVRPPTGAPSGATPASGILKAAGRTCWSTSAQEAIPAASTDAAHLCGRSAASGQGGTVAVQSAALREPALLQSGPGFVAVAWAVSSQRGSSLAKRLLAHHLGPPLAGRQCPVTAVERPKWVQGRRPHSQLLALWQGAFQKQ